MTRNLNEIDDAYALGTLLVENGVFDTEIWRQFYCSCCRNVWEFISDDARTAVELAERVSKNEVSPDALVAIHQKMSTLADEAWRYLCSLKEASDATAFVWPISDEVDAAWCSYLSAQCGKVATKPDIEIHDIPDSASSLLAWATARIYADLNTADLMSRENVEAAWEDIREREEKKQLLILRQIVGRFLCD